MPAGQHSDATAEGDPADVIYTCTIITTEANDTLRPIHHRMPVILPPEAYDLWLDRDIDDAEALLPSCVHVPTTSSSPILYRPL